jgi:hypothetical protein
MSVHREGETVNSRALITIMALVIGLVALTGCSDNSNELQRVVCEVESINGGVPLVSAALNLGSDGLENTGDDYVPIDVVPVVFRARAYNSSMNIPEDGAYSSFIITGYSITWSSSDPNAPADLATFNLVNGAVSTQVPVDDEGFVSVLVASAEMKNAPWFQNILAGTAPPFTAQANFVFQGHVSGTDHDSDIPVGLTVNFVPSTFDD